MLKLGRHAFADDRLLIMAIVNRTPDSFYDRGATFAFDVALERVAQVVADGAEIVDIGGVKAAPGDEVTVAEEIERTAAFVARGPRGVPAGRHQRRHLAPRGRRGGVRGGRRSDQRRLGRLGSAAGRRRRQLRRGPGVHARRRRRAAHASAPRRLRRRRRGHTRAYGRRGRARGGARCRPRAACSSTRVTTSARTPGTRWRRPGGCPSWSRPAGRCWSRCRTRTSSARRSTDRWASGWSARWRPRRSVPGSAPGCSARTTSPRRGRPSTWWRAIRGIAGAGANGARARLSPRPAVQPVRRFELLSVTSDLLLPYTDLTSRPHRLTEEFRHVDHTVRVCARCTRRILTALTWR